MYISYLEIVDHLDIKNGDIILLSSDIGNLFKSAYLNKEKFDVNKFIDSFLDTIGNDGTLLIPTYNWDFCSGKSFDYKNTRCKTGAIGSAALRRSDFKRTKHPIYSFAVWGKDKNYLVDLNNKSSFGKGSPFDFLTKNQGKNLIIDVEYTHSFTYIHHVEEMVNNLEYRYSKPFTSAYIDENNNKSERTYTMYVRNLDLDVINEVEPLGIILEKKGCSNRFIINDIPFVLVDLSKSYTIIEEDIKENNSRNLCKFIGQ